MVAWVGATVALFDHADRRVSEERRRDVAAWVFSINPTRAFLRWAGAFVAIFDGVFTRPDADRYRIRLSRSALSSTIFLSVCLATAFSIIPTLLNRTVDYPQIADTILDPNWVNDLVTDAQTRADREIEAARTRQQELRTERDRLQSEKAGLEADLDTLHTERRRLFAALADAEIRYAVEERTNPYAPNGFVSVEIRNAVNRVIAWQNDYLSLKADLDAVEPERRNQGYQGLVEDLENRRSEIERWTPYLIGEVTALHEAALNTAHASNTNVAIRRGLTPKADRDLRARAAYQTLVEQENAAIDQARPIRADIASREERLNAIPGLLAAEDRRIANEQSSLAFIQDKPDLYIPVLIIGTMVMLLFNYFGDYLSLYQTRLILHWMGKHLLLVPLLVVLDLVLTSGIFAFFASAAYVMTLAVMSGFTATPGDAVGLIDVVQVYFTIDPATGGGAETTENPTAGPFQNAVTFGSLVFAAAAATTYFTSVWIYLYIASGILGKAVYILIGWIPGIARRFDDARKHPITFLGYLISVVIILLHMIALLEPLVR